MSAGLSLPGFLGSSLPFDAWRTQFGLIAQVLGLCCKAFFEGCGLLNATSHGAAPFQRKEAGAQLGVLNTDICQGPFGDDPLCAPGHRIASLKS